MKSLHLFLLLSTILLIPTTTSSQTSFWQQTNGPLGGRINCFSLASDGSIFAGTEYSGIYRSTDDGRSWIATGLRDARIYSVASRGTKVVASVFGFYHPVENSGIRLSTDMGITWTYAGRNDQGRGVRITPEGNVFITTTGPCQFCKGVARTTDDGGTWLARYFAQASQVAGVTSTLDGTLIANSSTVWRSSDYGESWFSISQLRVQSLGAFNNTFFVGVRDSGVYRSVDFGQTWLYTSAGVPPTPTNRIALSSSGYILLDAEDSFAAGNSFFRSTDAGATWQACGQLVADVSALSLTDSNTIIVATANSILRTTNGISWQESIAGLACTYVSSSIVSSNGDYYAAEQSLGIFLSTNQGTSWERTLAQVPLDYLDDRLCAGRNNRVFMCNGTWIYRTSDHGNSWARLDSAASDITVSRQGDIFGLWGGVNRSTDDGTSWTKCLTRSGLRLISLNKANGYVYVGSYNPGVVLRSTDNGDTWQEIRSFNTDVDFLQSSEDGTVFAGVFDSLYRSTDNGNTWLTEDRQFTMNTLIFDGAATLYCGTERGVLRSFDHGQTWEEVNGGLFSSWVSSLSIDQFGHLVAGTGGGGVYRSVQRITNVHEQEWPEVFSISQNYPNPFNPLTTITFEIPRSGFVSLKVFDILGREVAMLVDEEMVPGEHQVTFDASALSSGVYFYRLSTSGFMQTKKLLLLR